MFKPKYVFWVNNVFFSVENQTTPSESFFVSHPFSGILISLCSVDKPLVTKRTTFMIYKSHLRVVVCVFVLFSTKL